MIRTRDLLIIFIPALLIAGFVLFIQILRYQPLLPDEKTDPQTTQAVLSSIPISAEDPILGSRTGEFTIVAFEDLGCEGCRLQHELLSALMAKYPNRIKLVWKGLSVTQFPLPSRPAHRYAYCAKEQGTFPEFIGFAFANLDNLSQDVLKIISREMNLDEGKLNACLSSERPERYLLGVEEIARAAGVTEVPTMFVNNKKIDPPQLLEGWEALLQLN